LVVVPGTNITAIQDISVLEVISAEPFQAKPREVCEILYELRQLDFGWGSFLHTGDENDGQSHRQEAIGSTQIDRTFRQEVERRLGLIAWHDGHFDIHQPSREITTSFEIIKIKFGQALASPSLKFMFHVSGLPRGFTHADARIENGNMIFTQ
jgi:hypothetical protein